MNRLLFVLAGVLCAGPRASAQDEPPLRDPTETARPAPDAPGAGIQTPAPAPVRRPAIALKALVIARGRPGVAIVDVDGALHRVGQGDRISVGAADGSRVVLHVTALTKDEVRIEIAALGETVVLR
jgi:hypothetical protein